MNSFNNNTIEGMICSLFTSISGQNYCPICGSMVKFQSYGEMQRANAYCPNCKSLERHRCLYIALKSCCTFETKKITYVGNDATSKRICQIIPSFEAISIKNTTDLNNMIKKTSKADIIILDSILNHCSNPAQLLSELSNNVSPGTQIVLGSYMNGKKSPASNSKLEYTEEVTGFNDECVAEYTNGSSLSVDYTRGYTSLSKEQITTYSLNVGYRTFVLVRN